MNLVHPAASHGLTWSRSRSRRAACTSSTGARNDRLGKAILSVLCSMQDLLSLADRWMWSLNLILPLSTVDLAHPDSACCCRTSRAIPCAGIRGLWGQSLATGHHSFFPTESRANPSRSLNLRLLQDRCVIHGPDSRSGGKDVGSEIGKNEPQSKTPQ